jgi:hypothetical protein
MMHIIPYATNVLALIVYFSLARPHPLYDFSSVPFWPVAVFGLFTVCHVIAFCLQETTRQLTRIYLLQVSGVAYDDRLLPRFQMKLTPNWIGPFVPIYMAAHAASFALLLFSLGWGVAIGAHVAAHLILFWFPIPYGVFLVSIKHHLLNTPVMANIEALADGFDTEHLESLIDEALSERRNLADWWAKLLWQKTAEKVAEARQDRHESQFRTERRRSELPRTDESSAPIEFFDLAQECFGIGHQLVDYRNDVSKQLGTLSSTIRNLFRSIDYTPFVAQAREIQRRATQLKSDVETFLTPTSDRQRRFADLLRRHAEDLHQYSDFLVQQADFMYRKSRSASAPGTSWAEWKKLFAAKEPILQECQRSGAELTLFYHEMKGNR